MNRELPFWKVKKLEEMSIAEWESLCDGCGCCCMHKVEDDDSGVIYTTGVACRLLDKETCQCRDYVNRMSIVPDCILLDIETIKMARWLPEHCAYRLIYEGKDLQWWHPLVSKSCQTVHQAQFSACEQIRIYDNELSSDEDYPQYITGVLYDHR
ncbi:YcgN family cysteine cluster protein [Bartonella sp. F02]|uniref:YcgN family cysteine cluster protein n=1 Tax=Bartonella sp. F02 TaxID=2967262 RepID=UPI0022A964F5|nr:YcgN family cysteine cluster protein [Bartonella sp. F02]MCZ2328685.1 YcgN family cysteine cluster protein [Bartonella sp. F02]